MKNETRTEKAQRLIEFCLTWMAMAITHQEYQEAKRERDWWSNELEEAKKS